MSVFRDSQHFYETIGELMERAKKDPAIGPKIAKAGVVIQFKYTDPDAITTINAKDKPTQAGAFVDVILGPTSLAPEIVMTMKADVSHRFWHGKVDLIGALAKKEMVIEKGSQLKIVQLIPSIMPLFKIYPALLKEKGYAAMIVK